MNKKQNNRPKTNPYLELAKMMKERENPKMIGPVLGVVESAPPGLAVRINEKILVKAHKILVAREKMKGYKRQFHFKGGFSTLNITFNSTFTEDTPICELPPLPHTPAMHKHEIINGTSSDTTFEGIGEIDWTDELVVGDKVIMIPMNDNSLFFLLDKADFYGGG